MSNENKRNKHNQEIIRRMMKGDSLLSGSSENWFWPDKSKGFIKKDQEAINKLYNISKDKPKLTSLRAVEKEKE